MAYPLTRAGSMTDWAGLAFVFCTPLLWLWRQSPAYLPAVLVPLALLVGTIELWGRVVVVGTGISRWLPRTLPLTLLAGSCVVAGLTLVGRWIGGLDTAVVSGGILLSAVIAGGVLRARIRAWNAPPAAARAGLWVVIFALLGATLWTDYFRPAFGPVGDVYSFKLIRDYFYHGQMILLHASPIGTGEWGCPGLAREPNPLYHYAGYSLAGILCRLSGLPVMDALTGFWLPWGFFLVNLAAGALATEWFGSRAAIPAVLLVGILPDPTLLPTLVGWPAGFSYYSLDRFFVLSPSNAYGVAAAGLALLLLSVAVRRGSLAALGMGYVLGVSALFFKAQCFLPAAALGTFLGIFSLHSCWRRHPALRARRTWVALAVATAGVMLAAAAAWPRFRERAPPLALAQPPGAELVEFLLPKLPPASPEHWIADRFLDRDGPLALAARALLVLYLPLQMTGGLFVLAALLVDLRSTAARRTSGNRFPAWKRLIPWLAMLVYLGLALLPAPNRSFVLWGNPWDYQLVPFAWTTVILLVWSSGRLIAVWPRRGCRRRSWVLAGLVVTLLVGPFSRRRLPDDGLAEQAWGHFTAPRGLVDCARFLREQTDAGDLIQDSRDDGEMLVEPFAERRAWVGWPLVASMTGSSPVFEVFNARRARHAVFRQTDQREAVRRFAGDTGIRWYLLSPNTPVAWREWIGDAAIFESLGHQVIDLDKLAKNVPMEPSR